MIFSYGRFRNCYRVRTASWPWATGRTAASEGGGGATLSRVVQGPGIGPRLHPYAGHRPSSRFNKTRLDYNTGGIAVVLYRHQQRTWRDMAWLGYRFSVRSRFLRDSSGDLFLRIQQVLSRSNSRNLHACS